MKKVNGRFEYTRFDLFVSDLKALLEDGIFWGCIFMGLIIISAIITSIIVIIKMG